MKAKYKLEICTESVEDALIAQEAGADRIEFCASLGEGGVTPSKGALSELFSAISIPVMVLIRPRRGDFLYTQREYTIMERDVETACALGAAGVVIGILRSDGEIDFDRCFRLLRIAGKTEATFHRAFDVCSHAGDSLKKLSESGFNRILTSGQAATAEKGISNIKAWIEKAPANLSIMPGSGIRSSNIGMICKSTGASEFHASLTHSVKSPMHFLQPDVSMGQAVKDEYSLTRIDKAELTNVLEIINRIQA